MKNICISIILFLLLIVSGCAKQQLPLDNSEHENIGQSMEVKSEPLPATFEMNEDKFDEGFAQLRNWLYFDENSDKEKYLIEEVVCKETILVSAAQYLPENFDTPLSYPGEDGSVCILENQVIYNYNLESLKLEKLLSVEIEENIINQCCISGNKLYYQLVDSNQDEENPWWSILVMDLDTGKISEIDNSDNYKETSLLPILKASNGKLTYLVGEEKQDGLYHYVYLYDEGVNKVIFEVRNVIVQYLSPYIDEKVLAIPDYFEDGWYLMIYELDTHNTRYAEMPFLTEAEFPYAFHVADTQIIYSSCYSVIYLMDEKSDGFEIIHDGGGGLHDCSVLLGNDLYFIDIGDLWRFDLLQKKKEVVYEYESFSDEMRCMAVMKGDEDVYLKLRDCDYKTCIMILEK